MEMSELHESIAGHFWEAIKGRLTEKSEGRVTEAELVGFSTSAIWSTQCSMVFTGHGWQVSITLHIAVAKVKRSRIEGSRSSILPHSTVSHSSWHPIY